MVIEVRLEQPENALFPILTTLYVKPPLSTVRGITRAVPVNEFPVIVTVFGPSVSTLYITSFTVNSSSTAAFTSSPSNINGTEMQTSATNKRRHPFFALCVFSPVFSSRQCLFDDLVFSIFIFSPVCLDNRI